MQLHVYKRDGSQSSETVEIPEGILAGEPNDHAIWLAVRSEEAAHHQGTAKTKIRKFVRGGGRKPTKQKGTGNARQGTIRSPLMPGGGTVFGPQPHDYVVKVPDKVKKLARRSAFMYKARENKIRVVEDFTLPAPKTQELVTVFNALGLGTEKVLFLTADFDVAISKSLRNTRKFCSQKAEAASTRSLMDCSTLLIQRSAVERLVKVLDHAA
jgi:large subunit ribosomal protein L4